MADDSPARARALAAVSRRVQRQPDGCWMWTGSVNRSGYGQITFDGTLYLAHRFVYTLIIGAIPDGCDIHHQCKVTACVNPKHLKPLTRNDHSRHHGAEKCERVVVDRLTELASIASRPALIAK